MENSIFKQIVFCKSDEPYISLILQNMRRLSMVTLRNIQFTDISLQLLSGHEAEKSRFDRDSFEIIITDEISEQFPLLLGYAVDYLLKDCSHQSAFDQTEICYRNLLTDGSDIDLERKDIFARAFVIFLRDQQYYWDPYTKNLWLDYCIKRQPYGNMYFYEDRHIYPQDARLWTICRMYFEKLLDCEPF